MQIKLTKLIRLAEGSKIDLSKVVDKMYYDARKTLQNELRTMLVGKRVRVTWLDAPNRHTWTKSDVTVTDAKLSDGGWEIVIKAKELEGWKVIRHTIELLK